MECRKLSKTKSFVVISKESHEAVDDLETKNGEVVELKEVFDDLICKVQPVHMVVNNTGKH